MSTQYDDIGQRYEDIKSLPLGLLEELNLQKALQPHIEGAKVLDLACGSGYYARKLLEWGAASVVGVDISSKMIEAANDSLTSYEKEHITFEVGDCSAPRYYPGAPFDIVVGAWLLNYAPKARDMTKMYTNISRNLKHGGWFVAICPYGSDHPDAKVKAMEEHPMEQYRVDISQIDEVPDGIAVHLKLSVSPQPVEFDTYWLRREVYEWCAREGGMRGRLEWLPIQTQDARGFRPGFWNDYKASPFVNLLLIEK